MGIACLAVTTILLDVYFITLTFLAISVPNISSAVQTNGSLQEEYSIRSLIELLKPGHEYSNLRTFRYLDLAARELHAHAPHVTIDNSSWTILQTRPDQTKIQTSLYACA